MTELLVGMVQQRCSDNLEENHERSVAGIRAAAGRGAELIVLQELHSSRYFCQVEDPSYFDLAERIPGPTTDMFKEIAQELKVVLVLSLFEQRAPGLYHNSAVVMEKNGEIAGSYRKMHIPDDPGYYEKFYFTPGDKGFLPISTSMGKLGLMICWDQWYPEAARLMALAGADLLIYPTAIGWDAADEPEEQQRQLEAWKTIQRSHAIANGLPVIAVNRVGFEPSPEEGGISFWGNSFACGSQGEILIQAGCEKEEVLVTGIDLQRCEQVRRIWPFLRDRRIDEYSDLNKRFRDETSK